MNKFKALRGLLGEPLAIDHRYMPSLIESIKSEFSTTAFLDLDEPELEVQLHSSAGILDDGDSDSVEPGSVVAVVPITGVMTRHGGWWSVGTSLIGQRLAQLDANPSIGQIVLDVDSPGGSVYGTPELSDAIYKIRKDNRTSIVAVADPLMASAATWTGTAAEKVYAIRSADVGSIGVISAYTDWSSHLEKEGIKVTIERTPALKARFSSVEPMTEEMRQTMQDRNVEAYGQFLDAMARNRGVDRDAVEAKFGGGEVMGTNAAIEAGLIDGVATVEEVVADYLNQRQRRVGSRRAAASLAALELESA